MASVVASRAHRAALWCCVGAGFATLLDASVIAYAAPAVASSVDASTAGVQWLLASYSLTFGLELVPAGRLGDVYGRRGLFAVGLAVFSLGAVVSVISGSIWLLVAGRLAQGLGAGIVSAQVLGVIQDTFHGSERVRALGAYSAAGALAAIVGPLLAGALLWLVPPDPGWRLILLVPVPFTLATMWLVMRSIASAPRNRGPVDLDLPGITLLGVFVVIVTLPVVDPGLPAPVLAVVLGAAIVIAVALAVWERGYARRVHLPLFAPGLMRSAGFVTGNVVALLWFGSLIAFSTVTTLYFLQTNAISAIAMAAVLAPASLARLVASRASSRVFVRLGASVVAHGVALETVCIVLVIAASFLWDAWPLFAAVAVIQIALGLSGGFVEPPLRAITLGFSPSGMNGVAASFLQLTQRLSATFLVAFTTGVLLGWGDTVSTASLRVALVICAIASLGAFLAAMHPAFRTPALQPPRVSAGSRVARAES